MKSKGVTLILVLSFILVSIILANAAAIFMRTQTKLSHYKLIRIQAFYAAQAGMNYALEELRDGSWVAGTDCTDALNGCDVYATLFATGDFSPASISKVTVTIWEDGAAGIPSNCLSGVDCIQVTTTYDQPS